MKKTEHLLLFKDNSLFYIFDDDIKIVDQFIKGESSEIKRVTNIEPNLNGSWEITEISSGKKYFNPENNSFEFPTKQSAVDYEIQQLGLQFQNDSFKMPMRA